MDMFLRNPRFVGLKFPDMSSPELIENKYQGKLTGHALSFLRGLLQMEPGVRTPACKRGTHVIYGDTIMITQCALIVH
jgi:cyclin-dependent kinase-like